MVPALYAVFTYSIAALCPPTRYTLWPRFRPPYAASAQRKRCGPDSPPGTPLTADQFRPRTLPIIVTFLTLAAPDIHV